MHRQNKKLGMVCMNSDDGQCAILNQCVYPCMHVWWVSCEYVCTYARRMHGRVLMHARFLLLECEHVHARVSGDGISCVRPSGQGWVLAALKFGCSLTLVLCFFPFALMRTDSRELGIQLYVVAYWDWDMDAALMQKVAYLSQLLPVSTVSATVND